MRNIKLLGVYIMVWLGICLFIFVQEPRANPLTQQEIDELMREVATEKRIREQKMQAASDEYLQKGIGLYREEKYIEALEKFQNALEANPENREASSWIRRASVRIERAGADFYRRGISLYRKGQYEEAIASMRKVPQDNPMYESARRWIPRLEEQIKISRERRLQAKRRAAARDAEDVRQNIFEEGRDAFARGDYAVAEARFTELLLKDPDNEDVERRLRAARREREKKEARLAGRETIADLRMAEIKRATREKEMMLEVEQTYVPKRRVELLVREEPIEEAELRELQIREMKARLEKLPPIPAVDIGAEIRDIIRLLMEMTGINIILDEHSVRRLYPAGLTASLKTVSPMPILDLLGIMLRPTRLGYEIEPNYIWISDREALLREDVVTKTYQLRYGVRRGVELREPGVRREERDRGERRGRERH
jgi:tetratricopeptide (TPR) repeat protein